MNVSDLAEAIKKMSLPYFKFSELPTQPAGGYSSVVINNDLAYISGQMPFFGKDKLYPYNEDFFSEEIGYTASKLAMINVFMQLTNSKQITDVSSIIKIEGFFAVNYGFDLPKMLDGASDLVHNLLRTTSHSRAVYGVNSLPYNAIVELSVIAKVKTNILKN